MTPGEGMGTTATPRDDDTAAFGAALDATDDGPKLIPFEPNHDRLNRARHASLPPIGAGDVARWIGVEPPEQRFTIEGLVPESMVTLLVSAGGAGKSLLLQSACTCLSGAQPFLGRSTMGGIAAGIFAEDSEGVLHLRQQRINEVFDITMESLDGRSFIQSYSGLNAALWSDFKPTPFMAELEDQLANLPDLRLVALDNVALLFAGAENDRMEVTAFLNSLNGLAQRLSAGIILSTHASKSSDGTTLRVASGSTAWVNAARSVLELTQEQGDDPPALRLRKANHARPGDEISLEWTNGVLIAKPRPDEYEQRIEIRQLDRLIFEKVGEGWRREQPFSSKPQAVDRYLPKFIARTTAFKAKQARDRMQGWIDSGHLAVARLTTKSPWGLRIERLPENLLDLAEVEGTR